MDKALNIIKYISLMLLHTAPNSFVRIESAMDGIKKGGLWELMLGTVSAPASPVVLGSQIPTSPRHIAPWEFQQ
jgi:hypothetical protein